MADILTQLILDQVTPGAILLGGIATSILYGITCLQTYMFFYNNRRDSSLFKLFIWGLWILDSLHTAMVVHALYYYLIQHFGEATAMLKPTWSLLIHVYFTIISDLCIRTVFAKRVWVLSHSYILAGIIGATTLVCAVTGFVFTSKAFLLGGFAEFHVISAYLYISLGCGVVSDILVAVSLCIGLLKKRTGFKKTDSLVHIIMVYTINTSLLTTLFCIACFITYAVWPNKLIFLGIYFCLNKIYFNSLLAALNTRQSLQNKISGLSTTPSTSLTVGIGTGANGTTAGYIRSVGQLTKETSDVYELESPTTKAPLPHIHVNIDRHVVADNYSPNTKADIGEAF